MSKVNDTERSDVGSSRDLRWLYFNQSLNHSTLNRRCLYVVEGDKYLCLISATGKVHHKPILKTPYGILHIQKWVPLTADEAKGIEALLACKPDNLLSIILMDPSVKAFRE